MEVVDVTVVQILIDRNKKSLEVAADHWLCEFVRYSR